MDTRVVGSDTPHMSVEHGWEVCEEVTGKKSQEAAFDHSLNNP